MKILKEEIKLQCPANELWAILSDLRRSDWVPSIEEIILNAATTIIRDKIINITFLSTFKAENKELFMSDQE